jgi:hypothetical protein
MKNLCLFFFLCLSFVAAAQQQQGGQPSLMNVIPPSPTAAALGKYGEIPVSLYTGVPNISIPLYEINEGDIKLPISLSYHASGIKVEEIASNVGLGWSLNAGGVITRTVRGADDDGRDGQVGYFYAHTNLIQGLNSQNDDFFNLIERGQIDGESDVYSYNFGSYTGKFVYDRFHSDFYCLPLNKLKIKYLYDDKWQITDTQGFIYIFEHKEVLVSSSTCFSGNEFSPPSNPNYTTTAWYISSIRSPKGEELKFNYQTVNYVTYSLGTETVSLSLGLQIGECGNIKSECTNRNSYETYQIKSIEGNFGKIEFTYSTARQDLLGEKMLDYIKIFSKNNELIKNIQLNHNYFSSHSNCLETNNLVSALRLKLTSIEDKKTNQQYLFEYNDLGLPHTMSRSQDHWGYYNGMCNTGLVPSIDYTFMGREVHFSGANRNVRVEYTQSCILKKIIYPTGGFSEFEYENNKVKPYINTNGNSNEIPFNLGYEEDLKIVGLDKGNDVNGDVKIYSTNFSLPNVTIRQDFFLVTFEFTEMGCPPSLDITNCSVVNLIGDNGYSLPFPHNNITLRIPEGNYVLTANFNNNNNMSWLDFYIRLKWWQPKSSATNIAGGLRIKKIAHYNGISPTPFIKNYDYTADNNESSGSIVGGYKYENTYKHYKRIERMGYFGTVVCDYMRRLSHSSMPLATSQGSYVGYEKVTVYENNTTNNGKIENYFSPVIINLNNRFWMPPYPPMLQKEWEWGQPVEIKEYAKGLQNDFKLVKQTKYSYETTSEIKRNCGESLNDDEYLRSSIKTYRGTYSDALLLAFPPDVSLYTICSEYRFISKIETVNFATESNQGISNIETKGYSLLNFEQNLSKNLDSKGNFILNTLTYPLDYTFTSSPITQSFAKGIKLLQDKHIIVPVIEQLQTKKIGNDTYITGGTLTEYYPDKPLPKTIWVLELANPILESSFTKSKIDANNNFLFDINYKPRISFEAYDSKGNLLQQRKTDDIQQAFIWGYNSTMPIAQVINANKDEIFHTSFEEAATGGSIIDNESQAKTGRKYFNGTYQVPNITTVGSRNYVLTYFQFENNEWKYKKVPYAANTSIAGIIDEVRIHPADALMTTITYKPLIGKSSETDANGITNYYEYDTFNRLKFIKDQDGNIVQKFEYKYAE